MGTEEPLSHYGGEWHYGGEPVNKTIQDESFPVLSCMEREEASALTHYPLLGIEEPLSR